MKVTLDETAVVTLAAGGNGTAKVGPISAREVWSPQNVHVSASSATNEAMCSIYVGDQPIKSNFRDSTFSGSSGDASDRVNADTVRVGAWVWAVWTGGDVGAAATMTVTGSKEV